MKVFILLMGFVFTVFICTAQTPVAWYPLNGNANDASGNNLNGTIIGTVTPVADRFGNANSAMSFNGAARIDVADNPLLRPTNVTLSAWISSANPQTEIIVSKNMAATTANSYALFLLNGNIAAAWGNTGNGDFFTGPALTSSVWHQVVLTFDDANNTAVLYLDGVQVNSKTTSISLGYDNSTLSIASELENGVYSNFFNGSVDEIKIYNTALTAAQVKNELGIEFPLPIPIISGGANGTCTNASPENMNGGNASGFGCGGGGAGWYGGNGGHGYFGGGGGGAAGLNQINKTGGNGGSGSVVVQMNNSLGYIIFRKLFINGTQFTVPANVVQVKVWAIGAGGGGAGATNSDGTSGGGGGAGGIAFKTFAVNTGDIISYTIGVAGAGGVDANNGNPGTATSVTFNTITITGNGGSGGEFNNGVDASGGTFSGGDGGSNGGSGKGVNGDSGGGAGGGIGGANATPEACSGGTGANAINVSNLFLVLGDYVAPNIVLTGALTGGFQNLKEAFDAINAGGGSGTVTVTVIGNTTETASAILNQTSYTVDIAVQGNRVVAGNLTTPLVHLNGADNVTINGQTLTGSNTLTFRNINTGADASAVRLSSGSSNNIVRKCIIEGSSTSTLNTAGALTLLTGTTGNSLNNILDSNLVRPATAGGLTFGIVVARENTTTTNTIENTQITNNLIENVFTNAAVQSTGILIRNNAVNNLIRGNSIYSNLTYTNAINDATYFGIRVFSTGSNTIGTGNIIDSNYVGGSAPVASGSKMIINSAVRMRVHGVFLGENVSAANSSVTRNVLRSIDVSSTNNIASSSNPFIGMWVATANLQAFNNNTIGDVSNNSINISMNPGNSSTIASYGMIIQPACATPIANNFIGGLTLSASAAGGITGIPFFVGLTSTGAEAVSINSNMVGSGVANNITVTSTAPSLFEFIAIENDAPSGTSSFSINNNIVRNITASHAVLKGISQQNYRAATADITGSINNNTITDLQLSGTDNNVFGITYNTYPTTIAVVQDLTINNNQISNFSANSGSNMLLRGIFVFNEATTVNSMKGRIQGNTISNIINNTAGVVGTARGITYANDIVVGDSVVIALNTINGITDASESINTGVTGNSNGITVAMNNSATNGTAVVRDNLIHGIVSSSIANGAIRTNGISVFGNSAIIERNRIYDLQNAATSSAARLEPILLRSRNDDPNTSIVRNNMMAVNTNTQAQITGVRLQDAAAKSNIYHNSILLEGSSATNSYALLKDATAIADVKNNILYNAVAGAGTAYAIGLQTSATGYTGNNNYFVSPLTASIAQIGAANHNFATWQISTTQDGFTQEGQSGVTTHPANLFLNKATGILMVNNAHATEPAKASDKGIALSTIVPNDFFNTVRSITTPDIGAHEFVFSTVTPLTLISFSGNKQNTDAQLQWRTANEIEVSHFELQRSDDGQNFVTIGTVQPGRAVYTFTDVNVFSTKSIVFYRLKSVDIDGQLTYSPIIRLTSQPLITMSVFPNPVQDMLSINGLKQNGTIRLFGVNGKLLQQQTVTAQSITINMASYAKGIYVLQYQQGGEVVIQKIIKQ